METNISKPSASNTDLPAKKIGKVRGGYMVITESLRLLNRNKSIMIFPLIAAIISWSLVVVCAVIYYFFGYNVGVGGSQFAGNKIEREAIIYFSFFLVYLVLVFVASFFQAGLISIVSAQISGRKMSFGQGMNNAANHAGKIFLWSLVAATAGIIMDIVNNKLKLAGRISTFIFGIAWGIVTFFIVPVLVLENETIGASMKRSGQIFKDKWGETLIANISTTFYSMLILAIGFVLFSVFLLLANPSTSLIIISLVLFLVFALAVILLFSTIEGIYRVVLYEYAAHNIISDTFSKELIINAIKKTN